jgi:hypothetical protein
MFFEVGVGSECFVKQIPKTHFSAATKAVISLLITLRYNDCIVALCIIINLTRYQDCRSGHFLHGGSLPFLATLGLRSMGMAPHRFSAILPILFRTELMDISLQ